MADSNDFDRPRLRRTSKEKKLLAYHSPDARQTLYEIASPETL